MRFPVRVDVSTQQLFTAAFGTNLLKRTETKRQYLVSK